MKQNSLCIKFQFGLEFFNLPLASILFLVLFVFVVSSVAVADNDEIQPEKKPRAGSENYYKPQKELLPGEEVITPSGKKIKVWSTQGGVETSRPPDPFANSTNPPIGGLIVDYNSSKRRHEQNGSPSEGQDQGSK